MDRYDADEAPTPELWLALTEEERKALVLRHHHGRVERTLHPPGYPRDFHATLHVLVENEVASKEPPITAQTLDRLCAEGLRRHAAVHALIEVLVRALGGQWSYTPDAWEAHLNSIHAGEWLGTQMRRDLGAPE